MKISLEYDYFCLIDLERTFENKRTCYWLKSRYGYTFIKDEAGKFLYEDAKGICENDISENTVMLPCK